MNKTLLYLLLFLTSIGCNEASKSEFNKITIDKSCAGKIQVLNFGTFHFTSSSDGNTSYIDVENKKVQDEIDLLNQKIADFKPTVILVEDIPLNNEKLQDKYNKYLNGNTRFLDYYGEMGLVAFEVGKLSNCKRIYGIDDYEFRNYDWQIGKRNQKIIQDPTYNKISIESDEWDRIDSLPLIERLLYMNTPGYRNFIININMDDLHYVNTPGTFDATDQAMRFYHRNVRWFANINKLELSNDDRVFILAGAAHTAFLHDMLNRSPKFCITDAHELLKK